VDRHVRLHRLRHLLIHVLAVALRQDQFPDARPPRNGVFSWMPSAESTRSISLRFSTSKDLYSPPPSVCYADAPSAPGRRDREGLFSNQRGDRVKPLARLHLPLVAAACLWAVPASAGQWLIDSSTVSGTAEADYSRPRNQYPLEEEAYVDNGSIEPANPAGTHGVQDLKAMDSFYWSDPRVKGNWLRAGAGNASELTSRGFLSPRRSSRRR